MKTLLVLSSVYYFYFATFFMFVAFLRCLKLNTFLYVRS